MPLSRLFGIEKIIVAELAGREPIDRLGTAQSLGERRKQNRDGRQPLLPVNNEQRRLMSDLGWDCCVERRPGGTC